MFDATTAVSDCLGPALEPSYVAAAPAANRLTSHVLFAPDTPPAIVDAYENEMHGAPPAEADSAAEFAEFNLDDRWTSTATNGSVPNQGQPITLTWSIVPDGTSIHGYNQEATSPSNLRSALNSTYNSIGAWLPLFQQVFDRWSALSGVHYVYEPNDDGSAWTSGSIPGGSLGVRGDVRIAGHNIDGGGSVLAYNFFPNRGDMVIDTSDVGGFMSSSLGLRNVLAHEAGHGLGLGHTIPVAGTKLLEPYASMSFDGPQFDDILAAHRGYGDRYEENGGNETSVKAVSLGAFGIGQTLTVGGHATDTLVVPSEFDFVSIDDNADVDYFKFTAAAGALVSVNLVPRGPSYQSGPQDGTPTDFNTAALSDLSLALLAPDGVTVLASSDLTGTGLTESLGNLTLPGAGTYLLRIGGDQDAVQFYSLSLTGTAPVSAGQIQGSLWNDEDTDDVRDAAEPALPGWTVFLDSNGNGALNPGEASTTTSSSGTYAFTNVAAGTHTVAEVIPAGWEQTYPGHGTSEYLQLVGHWTSAATHGVSASRAASGDSLRFATHEEEPPGGSGEYWADVWAEGDYAYLGHYSADSHVDIVDMQDLDHLHLAAQWTAPIAGLQFQDVQVADGIGYFGSDNGGGVYLVDVSDPHHPVTIGHTGGGNVHTLYVDGDFLYIADSRSPNVQVFNVANPAAPAFVRTIVSPSGGPVHEITIKNGRMYTAVINGTGHADIFDVSNVSNVSIPVPLLGSFVTGSSAHTSWASDDGKLLAVARETSGGDVKLWNIQNPASPTLVATIDAATYGIDAYTAHQPMIVGDKLYVAWYQAGTQVFDISNPSQPVHLGGYDTFHGTGGAFSGNWGVYALLGPDRILASDIDNGLFIFSTAESRSHTVTVAEGQTVTGVDFGNTLPVTSGGSPVASYRLGESSGTTANDSSGNGHNATYVNNPALGQPGALAGDTAVGLNGINQYVALPSAPFGSYGASGYTLSFETWFNVPAGGSGVILSQTGAGATPGSGGPAGWVPAVHLGTDGKLRSSLFWHGNTNARIVSPGATTYNDGQWHHVAVTYANGTETLYIDGVAVGQQNQGVIAYSSAYSYFLGTGYTASWTAGNNSWHFLNGKLDEANFYPRSLAASEVADHYAARTPAAPAPEITVTLDGVSLQDGQTVNFGSTVQGTPVTRSFTVKNDGTTSLNLTALQQDDMPAGFTVVSNLGVTALGPGQSTSFMIRLEATALGAFSGPLQLANNDTDENPFDLTLTGTVTTGGSPVASYRLGETSGTTANDSSGNGHNATYVNSPALGQAGALAGDTAVALNGVNQYVALPSAPFGSYGASGYTLSFETWFNVPAGGSGVILSQTGAGATPGSGGPAGWVPAVHLGTDGKLRSSLFWHGNTNARIVSPGATTYNDGQWHHVAVTYANGTETLYIDGVAVGQQNQGVIAYSSAYSYFLGTGYTASWTAGNNSWHFLNGKLDEANFYPRSLAASEVADHYAARTPAAPAPEITVTLDGVSLQDGQTVNFGSTVQGTPVTRSFTVKNDGTTSLNLTALQQDDMPAGFTVVSNLGVTALGPGQSTSFMIRLEATALGAFSGPLQLANNDTDENPFDLTLTGTVTTGGSPVASYRLGETSGTTANDSSGNGHNATYVNSPALGQAGALAGDTAVALNGVNQYVALPSAPFGSYGASGYTLSFETWFNVPAGGSGVILSQTGAGATPGSGGPAGWVPAVHLGTDGKLRSSLFWHGNTNARIVSPGATTYNDGQWHHVAVTYANGTETLYIDGVAVGQQNQGVIAYSSAYSYFLGTGYTASWTAGNGGWHFLNGKLDEAAVYSRALSAAEVADHHRALTSSPIPGSHTETVLSPKQNTNDNAIQSLLADMRVSFEDFTWSRKPHRRIAQ